MRQIDKNAVECPISLRPATEAFFQEGKYPDEARRTHGVRKEMVQQGVYIKEADALYKADDVKDKLETLYHNKCAYCEQHIESYHVEHYRPKRAFTHSTAQKHSGYHWLALSWDNLMLACPRCNEKKVTNSIFQELVQQRNPHPKMMKNGTILIVSQPCAM